jgi:hypothetical protein
MRSPALVKQINALTSNDFKTVALDRSGRYNRPKVHETTAIQLSSYPGTVRQLIVTRLGREAPTVIITNDDELPANALIEHSRMTIEQRLAEIIKPSAPTRCSPSSTSTSTSTSCSACSPTPSPPHLRARLPGYASVTPNVLQRRFLETRGKIITTDDTITIHLDRRAYAPVLRQSDLPTTTRVPGGETAPCATSSPRLVAPNHSRIRAVFIACSPQRLTVQPVRGGHRRKDPAHGAVLDRHRGRGDRAGV